MRKLNKEYQGKGYIQVVNQVRAEAARFSSLDGRAQIIDSALGNASDTVNGIAAAEGFDKWLADRGLDAQLPVFAIEQEKIDLDWAFVAYSGICSNTCYPADFGASKRDLKWLNDRGFIG